MIWTLCFCEIKGKKAEVVRWVQSVGGKTKSVGVAGYVNWWAMDGPQMGRWKEDCENWSGKVNDTYKLKLRFLWERRRKKKISVCQNANNLSLASLAERKQFSLTKMPTALEQVFARACAEPKAAIGAFQQTSKLSTKWKKMNETTTSWEKKRKRLTRIGKRKKKKK